MSTAISILLIGLLAITAWQDFKQRAIWWGLLPLLLAGFAWKGIAEIGLTSWATQSAANIALVIAQLLLVTAYFSLKHGKLTNLLNGLFGLGDLLFLLVAAASLATPAFVLWYAVALLLTLVGFMLWRAIAKPGAATVPLAGGMALVLAMLMGLEMANFQLDIYQMHLFSDILV